MKRINLWIDFACFVNSKFDQFKECVLSNPNIKKDASYSLLVKVRKDRKFFTIGDKQIGIIFNDISNLESLFEIITDRLEVLFEEYPTELEYSCDIILLELFALDNTKIEKIPNKKEAKNILSKSSFITGSRSFNLMGGLGLPKTVKPLFQKRNYSTYKPMPIFDNMPEFAIKFENNRKLNKNNKDKTNNYELRDDTLISEIDKNNKKYVMLIDHIGDTIHKRIFNRQGALMSYAIDQRLTADKWSRINRNFNTIYNNDNEILLSERKIKFSHIHAYQDETTEEEESKNINKETKFIANPNIGVIDLETTNDTIPFCYAIGFYTNLDKKPITFYIDENFDSVTLINNCFEAIMRDKYKNVTFYVHNLGKFDAAFILKGLLSYNQRPDVINKYIISEPLTRNSDIIKLVIKRAFEVKPKNKNDKTKKTVTRTITILDSVAVLPRSLRDLCRDYKVETSKGYFPYSFSIKDNLFYKGDTPHISYYSDLPNEKLYSEELYKKDWDLQKETLKYLDSDLISLHEVLTKVNKTIHLLFDVDLTKCSTVSNLASKIFFTKFYDRINRPIPLIKDPIVYNNIHQAYYGGRVEVFNPVIEQNINESNKDFHGGKVEVFQAFGHDTNKNYYYYDVNSLYPFASLEDMPGLDCVYIELVKDKINIKEEDLFGFFYCKIKSPQDKYLGLLPVKTKTSLIFPSGEWKGWYFSEELKLAMDNGYEVEFIKGYKFNRVKDVFKEFVNSIYAIKSNPKNPSEKNVAKLILNSLIGRFGMGLLKKRTTITDEAKHEKYFKTRAINNSIVLAPDTYLDTYIPIIDEEVCINHGENYIDVLNSENTTENSINPTNNVSISTAAAVLSYARIHMAKIMLFILENKGNIYYTDTDSIVTDFKLPDDFIHPVKLGKLKLEHEIKEGYFIADKTYSFYNIKGELIKKAKGVKSDSLTYQHYIDMYNNIMIEAHKTSSIRNYEDGYVTISNSKVKLNPSAYRKRLRIIKDGKWIGTKILNIKDI